MHSTIFIHHALANLLQCTFLSHITDMFCLLNSVSWSCQLFRNTCAGYLLHDVKERIHQFLASVEMKQFNTRQQANPLCLHSLEKAQCVSGVLPSLFCKYTSEHHCPKRDTIWSGLQVKWTVSLAGSGAGQKGETGDCKPPSCAGDAHLEQSHPGSSSYTETHT